MKIYLMLANGEIFEGESIGAAGECIGEIVFTTGMGGYMETLTDPAYYGQMVLQTFPMIGNYGVITADLADGKAMCAGYIVRELCCCGSNYRKESELDDYLKANGVAGISGIDTRRLTKIIRECGGINGMITPSITGKAEKLERIKNYKIVDATKNTTPKTTKTYGRGRRIVLINYGAKGNLVEQLTARGCEIIEVPCSMAADEILALRPEGIVLSGGAGDPQDCKFEIEQLRILAAENIPMLGLCLGHQLLALALGGQTMKLKQGHRGANQPVKDLVTGNVFITAQNHGYVVKPKSVEKIANQWMINLNDGSCEGLEYTQIPALSVQFHPQPHGGLLDPEFVFDRFIMLTEVKNAKE